jgi:HlyD family secretion protein
MAPPSARRNPITWIKRKSTNHHTITVASDRGGMARPMDLRLESRPTPLFPMVLGGSVALLVLTALAVAALVKVDQIVTVEGTLRTLRSTQDLKPDQAGVVTEVLVKEGEFVTKGMPLVGLDTTILEGRKQALAAQSSQIGTSSRAEAERLRGALAQLDSNEIGLRSQIAINRQQLASLRTLERQGAASRFQLLDYEKTEADLNTQLRRNNDERIKLRAESQQNLAELARAEADIRAEAVENREQLQRVVLRAPVAGTILNLKAKTSQVVGAGEVLLQLVPTDSLRAQAFISNQDLAFVRQGQKADIALAAYDRNKYGTIPGSVSTIGTDALPPDETFKFPRFPIDLKLSRQYVSSDGRRFALQAGMAVTADLHLERRTVLELFSSSILRNANAVRTIR